MIFLVKMMQAKLLTTIKETFKTDKLICYEGNLSRDTSISFISAHKYHPATIENVFNWIDLIEVDNKKILNDIMEWYDNNHAFDYFFPAILMRCAIDDFVDTEVMICLIDKLSPTIKFYNECGYFAELSNLSVLQLDTVYDFFLYKLKCSPDCEEARLTIKAIEWLNKRNNLVKKITFDLQSNNFLEYEKIADLSDVDGEFLCDKLFNINIKNLVEKDNKIIETVIQDYPLLSDEAFSYYMPACMIKSLNELFDNNSDIPFYTINNICKINRKTNQEPFYFNRYSILKSNNKYIVQFLELIIELNYSERFDKKMIISSLDYYSD